MAMQKNNYYWESVWLQMVFKPERWLEDADSLFDVDSRDVCESCLVGLEDR